MRSRSLRYVEPARSSHAPVMMISDGVTMVAASGVGGAVQVLNARRTRTSPNGRHAKR